MAEKKKKLNHPTKKKVTLLRDDAKIPTIHKTEVKISHIKRDPNFLKSWQAARFPVRWSRRESVSRVLPLVEQGKRDPSTQRDNDCTSACTFNTRGAFHWKSSQTQGWTAEEGRVKKEAWEVAVGILGHSRNLPITTKSSIQRV